MRTSIHTASRFYFICRTLVLVLGFYLTPKNLLLHWTDLSQVMKATITPESQQRKVREGSKFTLLFWIRNHQIVSWNIVEDCFGSSDATHVSQFPLLYSSTIFVEYMPENSRTLTVSIDKRSIIDLQVTFMASYFVSCFFQLELLLEKHALLHYKDCYKNLKWPKHNACEHRFQALNRFLASSASLGQASQYMVWVNGGRHRTKQGSK